MSFETRRWRWISDRWPGVVFLAVCLYLMSVYAEGQLRHTVRFLVEALVHIDRILGF